ncbi:uncharacterized protein F5891DRAFT_949248 [Suillus fuscotomentosus]|uniref:DUF6532 domain-containing protein n=1 Tax=Suillus fuscotomentosus TaxID=1912939 RepID=A0AAD4EBY4_9AGAM|nr:uncharacterized protein F5891DRAFT_949248 [Suillus fuscotomentosus]KAG1902164.1 hypothetical protein F5891DRAFT_949248 [Suillus fuscotomentosus]
MKFNKGPDGTRQQLKASDFDDVTKDLLTTATSIYRCLVMTQLTIQLTPSLVKMMTRRTSQVRGELKTKMRILTASFFGFRASRSVPAIKQNRDLAESLKEGSRFVFKDWEMKCGIYKTGLIQEAVNDMWFANRSDEGIVYAKYFDPLPVQTIALILTAVSVFSDSDVRTATEV